MHSILLDARADGDFGPRQRVPFHKLPFLHRFVEHLPTKATPEWDAVDYVPTQVLTELFLRVYDQPDEPLHGIVYNSAVIGEPAVVLDVTTPRCVGRRPQLANRCQ